jgi:ATP-binding cassette subfamily B protein
MTIKAGQKIALVGYNGAGKSTLVKLILRLYDPNSGKVLINGEGIKDFTISSYRSKFSTIFQDFRIYSASVAENVLCGKYTNVDEKRVNSALSNSGFDEKLASMPHGIDTVLTKEFDSEGINLSGGEAQKIAIARVFARDCDIVILDEPSSALDPDSEYELNKTLMTAFDKTVIIISHRLSTTRMADMIYMLEDGKIIEQGDHDSLMKLDGKYAEMFNKQAEKYNLDKEQYNG